MIALLASLLLLAAACGSDSDDSSSSATTASGAESSSTTTGASASTLSIADTSLGPVLVDGEGLTLYLFTPDTGTESTCYDACASAWPSLEGPAAAGDGIDAGELATTTRTDGSVQVTYFGHPLYYYAGDGAPGDVSGQNVGGNWFVVDAAGDAVKDTPAASTTSSTSGARGGY
jgi:predicted lipoprotein with Yx(FWY)xxD motif